MSKCHPLEVASRYRDPQLQVGKNLNYLILRFNENKNTAHQFCT